MLILLTGGSGRLGTELKKLRDFHAPSQKELDITKPIHPAYALYDLIVHCAAYTDVTEAEKNPKDCFMTNVLGTSNLAKLGVPILYISTEYVVDPTNYYAKSKLIGESILNDKSKILRLLFKPRPWPWKYAFKDQYTSGDYVDVIAKEVNLAIDLFGKLPRITNIGTGRKSMYQLAKKTRPNVIASSVKTLINRPKDTSLDISEWERIKHDSGIKTNC